MCRTVRVEIYIWMCSNILMICLTRMCTSPQIMLIIFQMRYECVFREVVLVSVYDCFKKRTYASVCSIVRCIRFSLVLSATEIILIPRALNWSTPFHFCLQSVQTAREGLWPTCDLCQQGEYQCLRATGFIVRGLRVWVPGRRKVILLLITQA